MNLNDLIANFNFSQRTVMGICIAMASLALMTFLYSTWQWRQDWVLSHQAIEAEPVVLNVEQTETTAVPGDHMFGSPASSIGNMPITNLQLQVTGIVKVDSDRSGTVSKAYISISGQPSKIYKVGEMLPYGVKIYDITPDAIVLENNGQLEKLPLPREKLKFKPKQTEDSLQ